MVQLPDEDPAAFTMILDIIHSRGRQVPRVVPLKLLSIISIVVDKYQLQDAISAFSDIWLESVPDEYPLVWGDESALSESLLWLGISWVFRDADTFKDINSRIIYYGVDDLDMSLCEDLPIPDIILGE